MLEELQRLLDRHVEHVGDALALEADLQRLAVVALAVALFAGHVHVGQEVHLDLDLPVAAADLAAPALDVEAETAGLVAACARLLRLREQLADHVEQARCRWPGSSAACARSATGRPAMILSSWSRPWIARCAPGRLRARCRRLATALNSTSLTSVDLPEPETPVTHVSTPSGTCTSMSRRLCCVAPRISM